MEDEKILNYFERPIRVMLPCIQEFMDERKVEFIDICEDFEGRDRMTFKCPSCGKTHTSLRFG